MAERILILAPHPDDEVVMCAAFAHRARAAGARVGVRFLTTGVPGPDDLWPWQRTSHPGRVTRRRDEARAAAEVLGLEIIDFSDSSTRSLRVNLKETRDLVAADLDRLAVDALWVPAFEGAHQDHDAAHCLAGTLADRVRVMEYAAYGFAGGRARSQTFFDPDGGEETVILDDAERDLKRRALAFYGSERGNLAHIGTARECRRPYRFRDHGRPPHPGRLWYARFRWVPFRHPRVDVTPPATVYADLAAFEKDAAR